MSEKTIKWDAVVWGHDMVSASSLCQMGLWPAHSKDTVDVLIGQATH